MEERWIAAIRVKDECVALRNDDTVVSFCWNNGEPHLRLWKGKKGMAELREAAADVLKCLGVEDPWPEIYNCPFVVLPVARPAVFLEALGL